ncbi:hypothetical protein AM499_07775 [Bacillus sp. FJAT-22090]|uniref:restriction endonuclease subunit S n=1 Tax=Bacillus sp. FJAT-22090 TaxID=1581038 RepID=UPI0006BCC1A9|nr:restriction endonuclease subunit S [Bacillus sp. FJAT-22090]ALC85730.1 hypothetical protein AM499_07775 [Bacillus sp. FJAT-22090]
MNKIFPKVRFEGFMDDWERLKLGEVVEIKDSARISNTLWVSKGVPYLRSSDLVNDGTLGELFISDETYQSYKDKTGAPEKDDVLFTSGGKVGITYHKIDNEPVYVQGGSILYAKTSKSSKLSGMYLKAFFGSPAMTKYIEGASTGVTLKHFTLKPANAAPIFLSSLKEQNKIGELFKQLDDIIALHQCMLEQKKSFKKMMLQKMFPQKGERVPKVRFNGFSVDWEEVKVEEMFTVTRGQVLSTDKISQTKTDKCYYPVYSSQTKNNGLLGYYSKFLFENAITWTTDGANAGTVNYRKGKFYSTNVNGVLISDKGFSNKAVSEILNSVAYKYVSKVGNPKLMNNIMKEIQIMVPTTIEEQMKIAVFLEKIDNTIALHQKKLEDYQQLKKALLQRMFI